MFKISDMIVYGTQGVCQIVDIAEKKINGESKTYFVLKPKASPSATFYVPTWNEKAWGKMRKVMTKESVDALIDSMANQPPTWIDNENERKEAYSKTLASGDPAVIIGMIQGLSIHKKEREAEGKRLHVSDAHFMKDAEQLLYNEWQHVLNVDQEGLLAYILARIEKQGVAG